MESTVRAEKLQTDNVTNKDPYKLNARLKSALRQLTLPLADALAVLLSGLAASLLISAPTGQYFETIDRFYIPLALACCLIARLYDRGHLDPVARLRMRVHAVAGATLIELLVIALKAPIIDLVLFLYVRGLLFFVLGFYIRYATENGFTHNPPVARSIHAVNIGRRFPDWIKRSADLGVSLVAGLLALPFVAASAAVVWLVDRGPVFYSQKRIGQGGRTIEILKIRTMYKDAEARLEQYLREDPVARGEWETFFKLRNDPRVLGWPGRFLRRTSLDELPQIWNILCGDMSFVGPRPFPSYHLDSFDAAFRMRRQTCKPGLTGLWQVSARSNGDLEIQRTLDLRYIANRSFWLDLYILLETVPAVVRGTGAC